MHRILIVDDEAVEREVVRFLLDQYNFSLDIHETSNGKDALMLLQENKFDILFTDICMPFIDGLELACKAQELYPDIHVIFFSGYDDFSYVKEALNLHAVNYILKPINSEEFKKTITDILELLHASEKLNQKQDALIDFTQNHVLYQLINRTSIKQLEILFPKLDLSFTYDCHRLFLIQLEHEYMGGEFDGNNTIFFEICLQHILPQTSYSINLNPCQTLILFIGPEHLQSWYQNLATKIADQIQKNCQLNCYIAISDPISHPDEISDAYEKAEVQIAEDFFLASDPIVHHFTTEDSALISMDAESETFDTKLKQLQEDIQFNDSVSLQRHMANLLKACRAKKDLSHFYFRFLSTNILKMLLDGLSLDSDECIDKYAKLIYRSNHFSEIEILLLHLTKQLETKINTEQESNQYTLRQVKQYIHKHYGEDLSLEILSKKVYLTPRYLSALFIKENECGINKYIKRVRMEKAQELLLNTNLKVSDICQKVGYTNLSYFCKSFAEEFGITPDKFRNQKSS